MDEDKQFQNTVSLPKDMAIKAVMISKMMDCVALLPDIEQELIQRTVCTG